MEELPQELKTMIHHILHRHKFYRLQIAQYHEILDLLRQPRTDDPHIIQHYVFQGIIAFNMAHKDQIAPMLVDPAYAHISMQSKALLHRILHEFHFLNCIRAYQLFQERFQQPASLTQPHGTQGLPFDDEFQKARLHYMYYGPYSVYHMGGMINQQSPAPYEQSFFPLSSAPTYPQGEPIIVRNAGRATLYEKQLSVNKNQEDKGFITARGRPPKDRKRANLRKISSSLKQYLLATNKEQQILEQPNQILEFCVCRGFLARQNTYSCPNCNYHYHYSCTSICLGCAMRDHDPFSKVVQTIGLYYLDWYGGDYFFEEQINMKSLERICSTGRFEIMVSCITPKNEGLTWPDKVLLRINEQLVFEVPPLLINHSLKCRKDTAYYITPYIFQDVRSNSFTNLERTRLSLETNENYSLNFRDNRKDIFLLGVFLVEKVPLESLMTSIIAQSRNEITINPLEQQSNRHEDLYVDHLALSCFDPYSRELIQTPVRGKSCQHFNCFDLQTFLAIQQASQERSWKCPICGKDARNLIVDKFQLRVMQEIKDLSRLPAKVTFHKGGKIDLEEGEASAESSPDDSF